MLGLTQFKSMIYIIGAYSETFYNIMIVCTIGQY